MSFINGCQDGKATPRLVEVACPGCKAMMEVFVNMGATLTGRTHADEICSECGTRIPQGTVLSDLKRV